MPAETTRDLTDTQWETLGELIPEPSRREDGRDDHGKIDLPS